MDSSTALALAVRKGFACHALTFRYGQRHMQEVNAAARVAKALGAAAHLVMDLDLRFLSQSSPLTGKLPVPKRRSPETIAATLAPTYVPARNTIFLSIALAWAEVLGAKTIIIGVNALDHGGYPDCRAVFVRAFGRLARLATKAGIEGNKLRVQAPFMTLTKASIVKKGIELGVNYGLTHSCFDPSPTGLACGECDACMLRLAAFREAGMEDPITYASRCDRRRPTTVGQTRKSAEGGCA